MKDREKYIINKQRFNANVLPELAQAIQHSNRVSCNLLLY